MLGIRRCVECSEWWKATNGGKRRIVDCTAISSVEEGTEPCTWRDGEPEDEHENLPYYLLHCNY